MEVDNYKQNNWLNVNLSTALFHTYKELELKFYQGKDEKEEECYDLTFVGLAGFRDLEIEEARSKLRDSLKSYSKQSKFPEVMKNFFGRKFVIES